MKKILLSLILILSIADLYSQDINSRVDNLTVNKRLLPPFIDTIFVPSRIGQVVVRPQDSLWYVGIKITAGGKKWDLLGNWIGVVPGGSPIDTTNLSNRINSKADSNSVWKRGGNGGTIPGTDFIGTIDNKDFIAKTNSLERLRIEANGNVRIKDTAKTRSLMSDPYDSADYEIIIFPDIQNMIGFRSFYSRSMFQWLKDSMAARNVKALIQVGDITNLNTTKEWDTLTNQLSLITPTSLPYIMPPGNHDYGNAFNPSTRDSTMYNNYLGVSHFSGKPWYGGHYGVSNENYWIHFTAGDRKYVAVGLEFIPRDVVLTWAGNLIDSIYNADPTVEVMVVTHAYISQLGELATDTSVYSGNTYGMGADNSGKEIWEKLIRSRPNIKWVFSGHFLIPNIHANRGLMARIVGVGDHGNLVNQIFINYQDDVDWGDGYFLRLQFHPTKGTVDAKVYSSYTNAYDSRVSSYVLEDPAIAIKSSIGVKNDVTVGRDLRVEGDLKVKTLSPFRIPYIGNDSRFRDTDSLYYNADSAKMVIQNIRAKGKINTDSLEFYYSKMLSRKNGKTRILFGDKIISLYVPDIFDTTATNGNLSRTGIYIASFMDSSYKMARGYMLRTYKSFEPLDQFTGSYLGSNIYQPEQSNSFTTRWYLPKGSYTVNGAMDFPNANVYNVLNIGGREDSVNITFGAGSLYGMINNMARIDLAPNASQYVNNYGTISNYVSFIKATRKTTSIIEWLNHYAVALTGGTDNGQVIQTMVGLHISPMQTGFTRRLWGVLQNGSTETYSAFNRLIIGTDTTIANMGSSNNLWSQGGLRLTSLPTGTKAKFLMIDAVGDVYAADTTGLYGGGGGGGSMVYPGAGIAVSTGSAWGTSITDNSSNWNTAFGWGNHAGLYPTVSRFLDSLTNHTSRFDAVTSALATKLNITDTTTKTWDWADITGHPTFLSSETDPVYSASSWFSTTNNSSNWNTAFGWGNHAGLYPTVSRFLDSLTNHTSRFDAVTSALAAKLNITDTTTKTWDWADITGHPTFLTSETDPVYSASSWFSTTNNSSNWNTAFGWGNHAGLYPTVSRFLDSLTNHTSRFDGVTSSLAAKQDLLVSGTNIKTINGSSILGSGNLTVSGSGLSDGDYGHITVGGSGTTMTIDDAVVTLAKLQNIASGKVIGRTTAGSGVPEEVTAAVLNLTSPATGHHLEYNGTTSEWENKALMALSKLDISGASQDTAVLNDFIPLYDATEATNKKIKVDDLLHIYNRTFRRTSAYDYFNEFINTVTTTSPGAEVMATNSGTGAATSTQATDASNRVGIVRTTTGTTATGRSYVNSAGSSVRLGGGTWVYEQYVNIATLSTSTERYQALFGFFDTYTAANQVDGAYLLYDEGGVSTGSTASANWQLVTVNNSTRTFTTTTTAVANASWVKLRVEVNAAGNRVDFFINNTNVGNHTTNIPTTAGRETGFGWGMIKSVGTTARTIDTDYLMVVADYTTDK